MTDKQSRALISFLAELEYATAIADSSAKEFNGNIKKYMSLCTAKLKSMTTSFTCHLDRNQIESLKKCVEEDRILQIKNINSLLHGLPSSNLDDLETTLEDIVRRCQKKQNASR